MPGPNITDSLLVQRNLPQPSGDGLQLLNKRAGRYGEQSALSLVPTKHLLADEGGYFTAPLPPGSTALQLGLSAAFAAAAAAIVIQNTDSPSNPFAKRIYLDRIHMVVSGAPTSATDWQYATVLDNIPRAPTVTVGIGGTPATGTAYPPQINNTNMDVSAPSIAKVWYPLSIAAGAAITVPAAGAQVRPMHTAKLRAQIPVVNDDYRIVFGSVDDQGSALVTAAPAGASRIVDSHKPVIIGPGQTFLLYMWGTANATAGIAFSSLNTDWWER